MVPMCMVVHVPITVLMCMPMFMIVPITVLMCMPSMFMVLVLMAAICALFAVGGIMINAWCSMAVGFILLLHG